MLDAAAPVNAEVNIVADEPYPVTSMTTYYIVKAWKLRHDVFEILDRGAPGWRIVATDIPSPHPPPRMGLTDGTVTVEKRWSDQWGQEFWQICRGDETVRSQHLDVVFAQGENLLAANVLEACFLSPALRQALELMDKEFATVVSLCAAWPKLHGENYIILRIITNAGAFIKSGK